MSSFSDRIFGNNKYIRIFRDTILYEKYYFNARRTLKKLDEMSKEDIFQYQYNVIKDLLHYAYKHVPYYTELLDQVKFKPEQYKHLEDIQAIPFLTKSLIRENVNKLVSDKVPPNLLKIVRTGGSTGAPLEFHLDRRNSSPVEFAYMQFIWKRFGYQFRDKCVILRGDRFDSGSGKKIMWKMNCPMNWLVMAHHHMNEETIPLYLERIREFSPKYLITYPSLIYILAKHMKTNGIQPFNSLQAIICSSETLHPWQRKFVSEVFKTKVFAYYGLTEKCCIASQCVDSDYYEFIPTYGYAEIINSAGNWCQSEGESGEIVATGFNNYTTPFIRYKTQDICKLSVSEKSKQKGWTTAQEITGRISEFLVNKNNGLVTFTSSDEVFWNIMYKLKAYQYIQQIPGELSVKLDVSEPLTPGEISDIYSALGRYFEGFKFEVKDFGSIPRTQSGKFRYLIQHIPIDFYTNN